MHWINNRNYLALSVAIVAAESVAIVAAESDDIVAVESTAAASLFVLPWQAATVIIAATNNREKIFFITYSGLFGSNANSTNNFKNTIKPRDYFKSEALVLE